MFRNFKEFVQEKILLEAAGKSSFEFSVASNYEGLAVLLTLIQDGNAQKARVLNWVMGQGLMTASKNREQLLNEVVSIVENLPSKIKFPQKTSDRAFGMKAEMVRDAGNLWGYDSKTNRITVHDLFSPEAYSRIPILRQIEEERLMPGRKTIFEYWYEKYEPKQIVINDGTNTNSHTTYDLDKIREIAKQNGLKPFFYGGFEGFMQWMEKGDWMPTHNHDRSIVNPNNQHGVNISPEKQVNPKTGEEKILDDVEGFDRSEGRARPIYHFGSGSYTEDPVRASHVIDQMQSQFKHLMHHIESKSTDSLDPQSKEEAKRILKIKDFVDSTTSGLEDIGIDFDNPENVTRKRGMESFAKKLGLGGGQAGGEDERRTPSNLDAATLSDLVRKGLSQPFGLTNKKNRWSQSSVLWPQSGLEQIDDLIQIENGKEIINQDILNDANQRNDGWFYVAPDGKIIFKFSQPQQDYLYKVFTQGLRENKIRMRYRLYNNEVHLPEEQRSPFRSFFVTQRQGEDDVTIPNANVSKIYLSAIINNALENDIETRDKLKIVSHKIKGIDPKQYTFDTASSEIKLSADVKSDDLAMDDKILNDLAANKGFVWEKSTGDNPHPFIDPNITSAIFTNGQKRYRVDRRFENGVDQFYLIMPNVSSDLQNIKAKSPRSFGTGGRPLWGSHDLAIKGGRFGGHIQGNALGRQDWQQILERLKRGCGGGLGEGTCSGDEPLSNDINYHDETTLPSVIGGITQAKKNFDKDIGPQFSKLLGNRTGRFSDYFEEELKGTLESWAVEALHLYSNDRAFQVGWISEAEYSNFIGNFSTKKAKKSKKTDQELELTKQDYYQNPELYQWDDDNGFTLEKVLRGTRLKNSKKGFGIRALLREFGVFGGKEDNETPAQRDEYQAMLLAKIKELQRESMGQGFDGNNLLIDRIRQISPLAAAALAKNGFEFRKRRIGQYVFNKMRNEVYRLQKEFTLGFQTGGTNELGEPTELDPTAAGVQARTRLRTSYGVSRQRVTPAEEKQLQASAIPVQPKVAGKVQQSGALPKSATPAIPYDAGDIDFSGFKVEIPTERVPVSRPQIPTRPKKPYVAPTPDVLNPAVSDDIDFSDFKINLENKLISFSQWKQKFQEMAGTYAIINPKRKPKDGDGHNVWGAAGKLGGVSITGEADDAKKDPTGENGRTKRKT